MRILSFILSMLIFGQSLSVCGPEIAHHKHGHSLEAPVGCISEVRDIEDKCSADLDTHRSSNNHACCKGLQHEKTDHSDHSDEEDDCCGDACHCFCCTKVLLNHLPYRTDIPDVLPNVSREPNVLITVHSFDFHPSISNPPQYLHLS